MQSLVVLKLAIVSHAALLYWLGGLYILFATVANKAWPKPAAPPWKVRLHFVFVDWPAALPSRSMDGKGIVLELLGVRVTLPLLSWSQALAGPPAQSATK